MIEKYQKRKTPEYFKPEDSETDKEVLKSTLKCKKATFINPKKYSDAIFQSDCVFTKENKNISFYESDTNNNYKVKKKKTLNKKSYNANYDSDAICRKKSLQQKNCVQEQFSYNYTNTDGNNKNNNNTPANQRVCLDTFIRQKSNQVPKRTIKTYQNQFDVEKSDNFNVLSYRPEDNDSNYIKTDSRSKKKQIFKKEDGVELFYPNKHQQALSPPSSNNTTSTKKEHLRSYQTPTLKYQSFFGSYTMKKPKNNNQAKSTSKRKINQLEDFNIDKLIEIGDNFGKMKNILSFGKKINNIKNKNKNIKYYNEKEKIINRIKTKKSANENQIKKADNLAKSIRNTQNKQENGEINGNSQDKKVMAKKIVYHGQIKRKRNIKNNKTINNLNDETNNQNKINGEPNKNFNINNEKKELMNNNDMNNNINNNNQKKNNNNHNNNNNTNNNNNNNIRGSYNNYIINNDSNIIDNNNSPNKNVNKNTNSSLKYQKINRKPNANNKQPYYNKNKGNQLYPQITPKKPQQKKIFDIHLNDRFNYSINNVNNGLEHNNYTNNHTMINRENKPQNDLSNKIILTEEANKYNGKNIIKKSSKPISQKSTITLNKEENGNGNGNGNKKFTKSINTNQNKNLLDKGFKGKNYYGYDERHNLEGIINNHSYYVSLYSKKKINQNNHSTDKSN